MLELSEGLRASATEGDVKQGLQLTEPPRNEEQPPEPMVEIEHPAFDETTGQGVPVDIVRVRYPRAWFEKRGLLEHPEHLRFVTADGRTHPACVARNSIGKRFVDIDVLCTFTQRIERGEFRLGRTDEPELPGMQVHPSVDLRTVAGLNIHGWEVDGPWYADVGSRLMLVKRCFFKHPQRPGTMVLAELRAKSMHPVVDVTLMPYRRRGDELSLVNFVVESQGAIHLAPFSARRSFAQFHTPGANRMEFSWPQGQCALPSFDLRIAFGGDDPLSKALCAAARLDAPVARFSYRRSGEPFLALGKVPSMHIGLAAIANEVRARYATPVDPRAPREDVTPFGHAYDANILEQQKYTASPGTQRFGCCFSPAIHDLSPYEAFLLAMDSSADEQVRGHFWIDDYGKPIRAIDEPKIRTNDRRPHDRSADAQRVMELFGGWIPRIDPVTGHSTEDGQHTDELAIHATLALWSRWDLELCASQLVERDLADARNHNRWIDGIRGEGRPWFSMANALFLFEGSETGDSAALFLRWNLDIALEQWHGRHALARDPFSIVTPLYVNRDPRLDVFDEKGNRLLAFYPYEHATVVTACLAIANVLPEGELKQRALHLGYLIGRAVVHLLPVDDKGVPLTPYVIGVPGEARAGDPDFGKLPPEAALQVGTPTYHAWVAEGHDGWDRWTVRAAMAWLAICERLGFTPSETEGARARALIQKVARAAGEPGMSWQLQDEYARHTAVPYPVA